MEETRKNGSGAETHENADALVADTYERLRRIARQQLRRYRPGQTLNTTAVVHEAYIRLSQDPGAWWQDRTEFLKVASTAMRNLVVDYARRRGAAKRGGDAFMVTLGDNIPNSERVALDVIALDDALRNLAQRAPDLETIVECRFFAGMTMDEIATVLGRSVRSVERDWARARAYLFDSMSG
jgi:RNA polymerase sigma factor (TIGR02999 family)